MQSDISTKMTKSHRMVEKRNTIKCGIERKTLTRLTIPLRPEVVLKLEVADNCFEEESGTIFAQIHLEPVASLR